MGNNRYFLLFIASFHLHQEFYTAVAHEAPIAKRSAWSSPECPDAWTAYGGKCYRIFGSANYKLTWHSAKLECNRNEAELLSIHSTEEQDFVRRMVLENGARDTWIGLSDSSHSFSRDFSWSDQSPLDFTAWNEGEPNSREEPCVHLWFREEHHGKWNDVPCNLRMQFICQVLAGDPSRPTFLSAAVSETVIIGDPVTFHCDTKNTDEFVLTWRKGEKEVISAGEIRTHRDDRFQIVNGTSLHITSVQPADSGQYSCIIGTEPPIYLVHSLRVASRPSPDHPCTNKSAKWIDLGGDYCYIVETKVEFSFRDAVYECYKEGGSLTSFHSSEEVERIRRHLKYKSGRLYIGLRKVFDGNFQWIDNTALDYRKWSRGQPGPEKDDCVEMNTESGEWDDISCSRKSGYVCSSLKGDSPVKQEKVCPETSTKWNDFGGQHCYMVELDEEVTWHEASQLCSDEGGSLASFHSILEVTVLSHHAKRYYGTLHIGLKENEDGEFEWVDKSPYDLDFWNEEPSRTVDEPCVDMYPHIGEWFIIDCNVRRGYVCSVQKVDVGISSLRPPLGASATPNICGGDIISDNGAIQTLNYPENYNPNENCLWNIVVPENYQVALHFRTIEVEYGANCKYDYIEVIDGPEADSSQKFCGAVQPQTILSTGNKMSVKFVSDAKFENIGFLADFTKVELCGGNIVSDEGIIQSRNYPENYFPNDNCMWKITVPESYKVLLKFHTFEIEEDTSCSYDYLEVIDGHDPTSPIIGRFCGSDVPNDTISSGHKLTVKFTSDYVKEYYGFHAEFTKTTLSPPTLSPDVENLGESVDSCGGDIVSEKGVLHSPNFPDNYNPYQMCTWRITVPENHQVILKFKSFRLEENEYCKYDFLEVFDGPDAGSTSLGKFCGSWIPSNITSSGNQMTVHFKSDSSGQFRGFAAVFKKGYASDIPQEDIKEEEPCSEKIVSEEGVVQSPNYPENYEPNSRCKWQITVPEGHQISLKFTAFKVEIHDACSYDYVEIRDGDMVNSPILAKLCGYEIPQDIRSTGNRLMVSFRSDSSSEYSGFSAEFKKEDIVDFPTNDTARRLGQCGESISSSRGNITSPNYPARYPALAECIWSITAPEGHQVILVIHDFKTEYGSSCEFDYVQILDSYESDRPVFIKRCGTVTPEIFRPSANPVIVKFVTDDTFEGPGFRISYRTEERKRCGEDIVGDAGVIESPNYPNNYDPGKNCRWTITVPEDFSIVVNFVAFDVKCPDDVTIIDSSNDNRTLGNFCGTSLPTTKFSAGNKMAIEFQSNTYEGSIGFSAEFEKVERCGEEIVADEGVIQSPNYPDDYEINQLCTWRITVPEDYKVVLNFLTFDVDCGGDKVTVNEVYNSPVENLCGSDVPPSMLSSGNSVQIKFMSDGSGVRKGFSAEFRKDICGGNISSDSGTIISRNYPNTYIPNEECTWKITVPEGHHVVLQFESFQLESCGSCSCDYVEVRDGPEYSSTLLGRFCGTNIPEAINSSSETMYVKFKSDGSVHYRGFKGNFHKDISVESELTMVLREFPSLLTQHKEKNSKKPKSQTGEEEEDAITRVMRSVFKK